MDTSLYSVEKALPIPEGQINSGKLDRTEPHAVAALTPPACLLLQFKN
jgi:hypothetical protein